MPWILVGGILIALLTGVSVWQIVRFFEGVTLGWYRDAGYGDAAPSSSYSYDPSQFQQPTDMLQSVVDQVKNGWRVEMVLDFWGPLFPLAIFLSLILSVVIIYCVVRILQIRRIERAAMVAGAHPILSEDIPRTELRWRRIVEQASAGEAEKWKLAILESDIMLNDLLDVLGYKGEIMADKMKQVPIEAFNTIDFAWEAHKVRNRVVHDPTFVLDARETKRIIKMYERVFREFKYIE